MLFRNAPAWATTWILLLAAGIAIPILAITFLFVRDIEHQALATLRERAGIAHLRLLGRVFRDASANRAALVCGGRAPGLVAIERDVTAMNASERSWPIAGSDWNDAVAAWRRPGLPLRRVDGLVSRTVPLFVTIADRSGATYDPEIAGINLADALTYRLPRGVDDLQHIQLDLCAATATAAKTPIAIAHSRGGAQVLLADGYGDVEDAVSLDRTMPQVERMAVRSSAASTAAFASLERFERDPTTARARALSRELDRVDRSIYALDATALPALDRIALRRVAALRRRYDLTLVPGVVAMVAAALFVLIGARSVLQRAELARVHRTAAELEHHATHDALTGLPNRTAFVTELQETVAAAHAGNGATAVLFIDLDDFKLVNDSLGHAAGDLVLCAVSDRLRNICHEARGEIVARFGGDEFAMLVHDSDPEHLSVRVERIVQKISDDLAQPVSLGVGVAQKIAVSASVGIASVADGDPLTAPAGDLLRDADVAMYEAKSRGRARSATFGPAMHERVVRKLMLTTDLRGAGERDEFELRREPIVRLSDGARVGCEALLRWQHPELGLLAPGSFLPVAEESGAIVEIGRWVLRRAIEELAAGADGCMHVNLSVQDLVEENLVPDLTRLLERNRIPPRALAIELTEGSLVRSGGMAEATLHRLRALGLRIWVDDFGVEYSSLRYIDRLPVDGVKIDRSFVGGADGELASPSIVKMILELAKSLDLSVIAEGIETTQQYDALVELGCIYGQGYLFTRGGARVATLERLG